MSSQPDYKVAPGDLITAQLFNGVQDKISSETDAKIKKAIDAKTSVQKSDDAEKLGGKTPDQFKKEIIEEALAQIPGRSNYHRIFKRLEVNKPEVVHHGIGVFPLVDAYQLDYFEVVCGEHEDKENKWVNFYLYHQDETELKSATQGERRKLIIETSESGQYVFKIKFEDMLNNLKLDYSDNSQSIGDLITQFWAKLFEDPNDTFDVDQYCNSPWFEKCCGENRSLGMLKQRKNWDNLWFQMRARKTINFPYPHKNLPANSTEWGPAFPNNLEIVHLDFNNIGVKLLNDPFYPFNAAGPNADTHKFPSRKDATHPDDEINFRELKVMLLLKA